MKNTEDVNGEQTIKEQWDYTYDQLNRLKTAVGNSSSFTYTYDSTGNRTQLNDTTYAYNEMNELVSQSGEGGTLMFHYDEYGNLIEKSDGVKTIEYVYDFENRLTAVKVDGQVTEEYVYDGDGNRIKKIDSDSERVYIYGGCSFLYEVNVTTQMHALYLYGPAGRLAKKVNDLTEYYHEDHLGSTKLITTENGAVTEEIQYEPFGEEINTSEERYTYNGKERDETGLYYFGTRYYDPEMGRFLTRDPLPGELASPQTHNQYVYCQNNPLKYTDPTGMETEDTGHLAYVILPDGTISYALADLYNKLREALSKLTEEDWANINNLLGSESLSDKMEAVRVILDKAGIDCTLTGNGISFSINGQPWEIQWNGDLGDYYGQTIPTTCKVKNTITVIGGLIYLNPNKLTQGGDLFMTLGHELVHAYHNAYHYDVIYSMYTMSRGLTYEECTAYTWSFTMVHSVPYITPSHVNDIINNYWKFRMKWTIRGERTC